MVKAYILGDEEMIFGFIKTDSPSKAKYKMFEMYQHTLGLNFIEFMKICYCRRFKELDKYDFYLLDAVDVDTSDFQDEECWTQEEFLNYFESEYKVIQ